VTNLLMNALLHGLGEEPGKVLIAARSIPGDRVEMVFSDNGRGIAPELHTRIFEPFFTTKRNAGGSGLGLSIVYNIAVGTLHGSIDLASAPGSGTRFHLTFPRITPSSEVSHS